MLTLIVSSLVLALFTAIFYVITSGLTLVASFGASHFTGLGIYFFYVMFYSFFMGYIVLVWKLAYDKFKVLNK